MILKTKDTILNLDSIIGVTKNEDKSFSFMVKDNKPFFFSFESEKERDEYFEIVSKAMEKKAKDLNIEFLEVE